MRLLSRSLVGLFVLLAPGPASLGSGAWAMEEPRPRIVAIGDVHGSPEEFSRVLRAAELVDETGDWIGGNAILVQTGDLTDRGPGVRAVLDLMRDLERSAAENGGQVVSLLGNHEVFNLVGHYDYQSTPLPVFAEIAAAFGNSESEKTRKRAYKQWSRWAKKYPACAVASRDDWMARNPLGFIEYQEAMSPRGEYGRWLRAREIVVDIQGTLFLHGGLSPELLDMGMRSLDSINDTAAAELAKFDRDRNSLEKEGVIPRYSTVSELHCALAYEIQALGEDELDELAPLRREGLEEMRARLPGAEGWLLLDPRGPVWFRGYASWSDEEAEAGLATVFGTFGGTRVVVGHTPRPGAVVVRFQEQVFLIDTAMAYPDREGRAVALEIRGDTISAIDESGRVSLTGLEPENDPDSYPDSNAYTVDAGAISGSAASRGPGEMAAGAEGKNGQTAEPESGAVSGASGASGESGASVHAEDESELTEGGTTFGPERDWLAQDGSSLPFADEAAVLDFLKTAEVIGKRNIGKGVTLAKILVLEKDGVRARAAFHDIDVTKRRYRSKSAGVILNFRDSYLNNAAAYELGRLLGLTNMAPTTLRRIGRTRGSIQLWIEYTIDETERRAQSTGGAMSVLLRRRIGDMWVFDNLINNVDRNQGNMLHDARGEFWMIDHTRTFNGSKRLPSPQRMKRCSRELHAAIRSLDEDQARERLRPYLSTLEINSLFARRKKLLEYVDERSAAQNHFMFSYDDADDAVTVTYEDEDIPVSANDG